MLSQIEINARAKNLRFEIKCCRALAAEFDEIQHIAVAVNQIFRNRLHNTAAHAVRIICAISTAASATTSPTTR